MKLKAVVFLGLVTASLSAYADWQYTKWGMTPDELVAAAKNAKQSISKSKHPDLISRGWLFEGEYRTNIYRFKAIFIFSKNPEKLKSVSLQPSDKSQCNVLMADLIATYGPQVKHNKLSTGDLLTWNDAVKKNEVQLVIDPSICFVTYNDTKQSAPEPVSGL